MTTTNDIESRLLHAVAVEPDAAVLRRLDERVARAMAVTGRGERGSLTRFMLRPLALAALLLLIAGTVGATVTLLDRLIGDAGPGWQTAWDRAEVLDLRQTDAGVTITLVRGYADLNQVLVGFTVEGLEAVSGSTPDEPIQWSAQLRDPQGRGAEEWATMMTGRLRDQTGLSAVVQTWEGAAAATGGTWELTFTSVGYGGGMVPGECTVGATAPACVNPPANARVEGTWRFTFDLPAPAGTVVPAAVSDTRGAATLTLTELVVSPTVVRAAIALRVSDSRVTEWHWLDATVRHGATSYPFTSSYHVTQDPDAQGEDGDLNAFMSQSGSDDIAGTWEFVIPALDYSVGTGDLIHVEGPWTLTLTVP